MAQRISQKKNAYYNIVLRYLCYANNNELSSRVNNINIVILCRAACEFLFCTITEIAVYETNAFHDFEKLVLKFCLVCESELIKTCFFKKN